MFASLKERVSNLFRKRESSELENDELENREEGSLLLKILTSVLAAVVLVILGLGIYWSLEPDSFSVSANQAERLAASGGSPRPGSASAATLIRIAQTLLDKPGGYLSNDVMPPGLYLDNIPNWEFGVLVQVRDFSRAFRESFSRSQSQSEEDRDLREAEPLFSFDYQSWMFPPTESEYGRAIGLLDSYLDRLTNPQNNDAQFFARADNLASWLMTVESRLGSLSCRLSACVGENRLTSLPPGAELSDPERATSRTGRPGTPWLQVDDIFYEARGTTWALLHFLLAVKSDFADVLEDKNAMASLDQIIRDLELSQRRVFPVILNGSGFGIFANHSLTMANYVSRANAAIIDLRSLLAQG
ncbi:MAG: DUF2333 family protein [Gammaproteobacteria bacterium]|nr:DUF2333 family protein [Pseudomonadales bacterium]MCP5346889.1 DUF2333 family protein [Pseudomonadales bacterium]